MGINVVNLELSDNESDMCKRELPGASFSPWSSPVNFNSEAIANHRCYYKEQFDFLCHTAATVGTVESLIIAREHNYSGMEFLHLFGATTNILSKLYYTMLWIALGVLASTVSEDEFNVCLTNLLKVELADIVIPAKDVFTAIIHPWDVYLFTDLNFSILVKQLKEGFSNCNLIRSSKDRGIPVCLIAPESSFVNSKPVQYRQAAQDFDDTYKDTVTDNAESEMYDRECIFLEKFNAVKDKTLVILKDETIWKGMVSSTFTNSCDRLLEICKSCLKCQPELKSKSPKKRRIINPKYNENGYISTFKRFKRTASLTFNSFFEDNRDLTNIEFHFASKIFQTMIDNSFGNFEDDNAFFKEVRRHTRMTAVVHTVESQFNMGIPLNRECEFTTEKPRPELEKWVEHIPSDYFVKQTPCETVITRSKFMQLPESCQIEELFTIKENIFVPPAVNDGLEFNPLDIAPRPKTHGTNCGIYSMMSAEEECSIASDAAEIDSGEYEYEDSSEAKTEETSTSSSESILILTRPLERDDVIYNIRRRILASIEMNKRYQAMCVVDNRRVIKWRHHVDIEDTYEEACQRLMVAEEPSYRIVEAPPRENTSGFSAQYTKDSKQIHDCTVRQYLETIPEDNVSTSAVNGDVEFRVHTPNETTQQDAGLSVTVPLSPKASHEAQPLFHFTFEDKDNRTLANVQVDRNHTASESVNKISLREETTVDGNFLQETNPTTQSRPEKAVKTHADCLRSLSELFEVPYDFEFTFADELPQGGTLEHVDSTTNGIDEAAFKLVDGVFPPVFAAPIQIAEDAETDLLIEPTRGVGDSTTVENLEGFVAADAEPISTHLPTVSKGEASLPAKAIDADRSRQAWLDLVKSLEPTEDPFAVDLDYEFKFEPEEEVGDNERNNSDSNLPVSEPPIHPILLDNSEEAHANYRSASLDRLSTIWEESDRSYEEQSIKSAGTVRFREATVNAVSAAVVHSEIPRPLTHEEDELSTVSSIDYNELRAIVQRNRNMAAAIALSSEAEPSPEVTNAIDDSVSQTGSIAISSVEENRNIHEYMTERNSPMLSLNLDLRNLCNKSVSDLNEEFSLSDVCIDDSSNTLVIRVSENSTGRKSSAITNLTGFLRRLICRSPALDFPADYCGCEWEGEEYDKMNFWSDVSVFAGTASVTLGLSFCSILPVLFKPVPVPPPPLSFATIYSLCVTTFFENIRAMV